VPGAQTVNEDTALIFNGGNVNLISITDPDAESGNETVTLSVNHGTLTLGSTAGLGFDSGTNGTGNFTFHGTLANVNVALTGLTYQGNPNFNGSDTLTITTNDNGNTPPPPLQDQDTVAITVSAVNDAPVVVNGTTVALVAIDEDTLNPTGVTVSLSYVVKNIGAGDDAVSSWAGVFLDNDFATTFQHNTWNLIGPILAGNTVRTNNSISTSGLALGDHTLTVKADYWNDTTHTQGAPNDVAEGDETNNATTIHFTVQQAAAPAALPDLVVDSITNPSVVNQGDSFGFSYVIKDIGTGDVHAASWAGIFLDGQATTLFGGTSLSGWNYISAMGAGGAVTAGNSFSTAGLLGTHTLTIEADYWNDATGMANNGSNDVAESNEHNNSATINFTVNAPVAPVLPDLDVDSITPNAASVSLGSNFSFSYYQGHRRRASECGELGRHLPRRAGDHARWRHLAERLESYRSNGCGRRGDGPQQLQHRRPVARRPHADRQGGLLE
jgi:hypothetical protein